MTPHEHYKQKLKLGEIEPNEEQASIISILDTIYQDLVARQKIRDSQLGQLRRKIKPRAPIKGLYLWGNVGTGKTMMIDIFYECVPVRKIRLHFHAFMRQIQASLKETQGIKNPIQKIAKEIADDVLVICFDEFFVADIADAMILGTLFTELFKGGLCLVTTSNLAPDDLYKNGLQRERFLPAIQTIKSNVHIQHLGSVLDYRRQHHHQAGVYFTPLDARAEQHMEASFQHYANALNFSSDDIEILGRQISIIKQVNKTIWFDFYKICGRPRSQNDYLELAKNYDNFLISNVPAFDHIGSDLIVSFIHLIDVLYDQQKRAVISAEMPVDQLYHGTNYQTAFDRTRSRLIEMQSKDYLSNNTDSD